MTKNMKVIGVLVALLMFPVQSFAIDEICTFTGTGNWGPIGTWGGTDNCTPDGNDSFVIADEAVVTIIADVTQNNVADIGITVQDGGTLILKAENKSGGTPGKLTLTVGGLGLDCQTNSTCIFQGMYREWGAAVPAAQEDRDDTAYFSLPQLIIPCMGTNGTTDEPDCNAAIGGDPSEIVLRWTDEVDNVCDGHAPCDLYLDETLQEIAVGDVMCFLDPDTSDVYAPHDSGYCYDVTAVNHAASPYDITVSVHQGTRDQFGYPLDRREVTQTSLTADVGGGDRFICVDGTTTSQDATLDEDYALIGRWVRFIADDAEESTCDALDDGASCEVADYAYRIMRTYMDDAGCGGAGFDRIDIIDARGFRENHSNGDVVWIDYGWMPGDPVYFFIPVEVTSATATDGDSAISFDGTLTVKAAVFNDMQQMYINGATITEFKDSWSKDTTGGPPIPANATIRVENVASATFDHITGTGGNDQTDCYPSPPAGATCAADSCPCEGTHGIIFYGTDFDITVNDAAFRHNQDDSFYVGSGNAGSTVTLNRARSQWASQARSSVQIATSQTPIESQINNAWVVRDFECVDCIGWGGGDQITNINQGTPANPAIERIMLIGDRSRGRSSIAFKDFYRIGANLMSPAGGPASTQIETIMPKDVDRFVVRDFANPRALLTTVQNHDATTLSWKNGILKDVYFSYPYGVTIDPNDTSLIENVAFINVGDASCDTVPRATCYFIRFNTNLGTGSLALRNITWTQTPSWSPLIDNFFGTSSGANLTGVVWSKLLFLNTKVNNGGEYLFGNGGNQMQATQVQQLTADSWCFFNTKMDWVAATENVLPSDTIRGVAPPVTDRQHYRVDNIGGGVGAEQSCGVKTGRQAPGISRHYLYHSWSGIEPEAMGFVGGSAGSGMLL